MILRAVLLLLLAIGACGRETAKPGTISKERFIEANVELRQIPPNDEDAEERRRHVLEELDLTEDQLLEFIERGGLGPAELREIWSEITRRLEERQRAPTSGNGGQSI